MEEGNVSAENRRHGWVRACGASCAALVLLLLPAHCHLQAQEAQAAVLKTNPAVALRDFQQPVDEEYQLGRGDEISIDFAGRPELDSKQVLGPDGRITLPLAGGILIADRTREQAAALIVNALAKYYSGLSVTVGVEKYTSNQILLVGAVEHPGLLTFDRPPTLLEVVTRGGGVGGARASVTSNTSYNIQAPVQPSFGGVPERVAVYRGSNKVIWIDLKKLLDSGSPLADLRLKRDDVVYVPSGTERYVSILGAVQHPGALQLTNASTLPQLIALAGGLSLEAGHYPNIQVIDPSTGKTRVVSFKQVLQPSPLDLTLHSGDIIYVPESKFSSTAYVLDKLSPLVTAFTATAAIAH